MQLRKATMEDLDTVMDILRDGRNQLAERGIDQWQGDYPNEEHIKEDIQHGWAYLVESDDDQTVGALANCGCSRPLIRCFRWHVVVRY